MNDPTPPRRDSPGLSPQKIRKLISLGTPSRSDIRYVGAKTQIKLYYSAGWGEAALALAICSELSTFTSQKCKSSPQISALLRAQKMYAAQFAFTKKQSYEVKNAHGLLFFALGFARFARSFCY